MGFYPVACMVTGLDLREVDTYLVPLLEDSPGHFRPFALPILGPYDYYGGIDVAESDELVILLDRFTAHCLRTGRLTVDHTKMPSITDDDTGLMEFANRNHVALDDGKQHACTLDGHNLAYALIAQGAWDTAVEIGAQQSAGDDTPPAPAADPSYLNEIYGENLPHWREQLDALTAFDAALPVLNRHWFWPEFIDDTSTSTRLTEARTTFAGNARFQRFFDHYEQVIED